jgi:ethanolamine ammonia-lyase small subunit
VSGKIAKPERPARDSELDLTRFTPARVSLGQAGPAIPTREQLRFQLDHALARDAVHARLDVAALVRELQRRGMDCIALRSAVAEEQGGGDRRVYLRRPDLGRRLHAKSAEELRERAAGAAREPEAVFVIADGLSALAVERHAAALLDEVAREGFRATPVCLVSDGRVAVGDEIGAALQARLVVVLIGERPGLSSPDSLGAYITWNPRPGRTDAERNCISNIRAEGLSYREAARRLAYYMNEARRLEMTGVLLKERSVKAIEG